MVRPLAGRAALVTGSTQGLGRAIAERLAADGCDVVLNGLGPPAEIECGTRVLHDPTDLREPAAIEAMMARAADAFGAIDILVNNAVVRHAAPVDAFPLERWDEALAVNLSAAFHTIRLAVPAMRRRGFGRIVNVASGYAFFGAAGRVAYVTTKTALLGLTRAVAMDLIGERDITCNAICPATAETPDIAARIDALAAAEDLPRAEAVSRYLSERQPSGRFIEAGNVAALVAFLCSPAGADITGAALPIDGGWSAS